jgi:nucleotide-binding universal stress UspA family protein
MKILIAYDGTPGARAVFSDLRRAGLPAGVTAGVLSVATAGRVPTGRALLIDEARLLAEAGAGHVRALFPKWTVSAHVVEGAAAAAIVAAADEWAADLVIVGTRGLNDRERLELGSVAREVVTNARTSVRVARPSRAAEGDAPKLLVGYDGSRGAEDAVGEICGRRWPKSTEVRIVAADGSPPPKSRTDGAERKSQREFEQALDAASAQLAKAGLKTSSAIRTGEAKRALLDEADTWGPDAIFLGGRRLQRLRRFLFGSVAGSVADDAPCSVEVVRPASAG